jgi:hypothetical protein
MSEIADISNSIVTAVNGKNVQIGAESEMRIILAERQRIVFDSQGSDFYIEVCGPWPETIDTSSSEKHIGLHYVLEAHIYKINDTPPSLPATEQTENVGDTLAALITADGTRGGKALLTRIDGIPYYAIMGDSSAPEFIMRLDVIVEYFSLITD